MVRKKAGKSVTEQLIESILDSGQSLRAIGRECGVDHGQLSRFVRGERDITSDAISKLADYLGLGLVKRR